MESQARPLEVRSLVKSFGRPSMLPWQRKRPVKPRSRALDSISFSVERGEIFGIIGANGSGKSTLIRIISTLLLPDEGSVSVFGADVAREAATVRPYINRVSVDPSFFKNMSTIENLLFFGRIYGLSKADIMTRVPQILQRLGFETARVRQSMSDLSRGQQQKVALARSFLTSPMLMLLDEPTTGLDPRSKRDVQSFILDVRREHDATVLLTTHDMDEADALCDRLAFLSNGRIIATGTPLELRYLVANGAPIETITMERVFLELTGRSIEEDEETKESVPHG